MPRPKDPALEAQRRRQLLDATVALLGEEAFHAMTQSKVAKRAGVSTGLLCVEIDLQPEGRQMLDAAQYVFDES